MNPIAWLAGALVPSPFAADPDKFGFSYQFRDSTGKIKSVAKIQYKDFPKMMKVVGRRRPQQVKHIVLAAAKNPSGRMQVTLTDDHGTIEYIAAVDLSKIHWLTSTMCPDVTWDTTPAKSFVEAFPNATSFGCDLVGTWVYIKAVTIQLQTGERVHRPGYAVIENIKVGKKDDGYEGPTAHDLLLRKAGIEGKLGECFFIAGSIKDGKDSGKINFNSKSVNCLRRIEVAIFEAADLKLKANRGILTEAEEAAIKAQFVDKEGRYRDEHKTADPIDALPLLSCLQFKGFLTPAEFEHTVAISPPSGQLTIVHAESGYFLTQQGSSTFLSPTREGNASHWFLDEVGARGQRYQIVNGQTGQKLAVRLPVGESVDVDVVQDSDDWDELSWFISLKMQGENSRWSVKHARRRKEDCKNSILGARGMQMEKCLWVLESAPCAMEEFGPAAY